MKGAWDTIKIHFMVASKSRSRKVGGAHSVVVPQVGSTFPVISELLTWFVAISKGN